MVKKETKKSITVVNIVVSTSLEHDIPLEKMAATLSNTEYNPEQFPGLVIRIKEPKTSALIFSSGKVVCTGAKSISKVKESIQKIIENYSKLPPSRADILRLSRPLRPATAIAFTIIIVIKAIGVMSTEVYFGLLISLILPTKI